VTVTLTGTNQLGQTVTMTTTTDSNGYYHFDGLRPGTYNVVETQPNYREGKTTHGNPFGGDDTSVIDQIGNILIAAHSNTTGTEYDFGELLALDVTNQVLITRCGLIYNPFTHRYSENVTIKNTGATALNGPLNLVTSGLTGTVSMYNADGQTSTGLYYKKLVPPGGTLAAGQSMTLSLQFASPSFPTLQMTYTPQLFVGVP
jgi:hypothetical protein